MYVQAFIVYMYRVYNTCTCHCTPSQLTIHYNVHVLTCLYCIMAITARHMHTQLTMSLSSIAAPICNSSIAVSTSLSCAARCSGVQPLWLRMMTASPLVDNLVSLMVISNLPHSIDCNKGEQWNVDVDINYMYTCKSL